MHIMRGFSVVAASACGAIAFAEIQIIVPPLVNSTNSQVDQSKNSQQAPKVEQQGTDKTPLVVNVLPTQRTVTETADETKDRAEKLSNDKKLVAFNGSLTFATWVLGGIGLLQLIVYSIQAQQMRRTVKAAAEQSEAMDRSINEAKRLATSMEIVAKHIETSAKVGMASVEILRERTAAQMRAYLCVNIGGAVFQDRGNDLRFEGKPLLVNAGHTPAYNVSYRAKAAILPAPLPDNLTLPIPDEAKPGAVLGPQQNATINAIVDSFCTDGDVERIKRGERDALHIWGIVTYDDIFGERHETKFCQSIVWLPPNNAVIGYYIAGQNSAT